MNNHDVILDSDSYKTCHGKVYRKGTETIYSYFEARLGAEYDEAIFFGLQYLLKKLEGVVITQELIDATEPKIAAHFWGDKTFFNRNGWEYIVNNHGGKLPIRIKAVAEGTILPVSNVMFTIENTGGENTNWLTNYLETYLSRIWYPITVATRSYQTKKVIKKFVDETSDADFLVKFMLHDFGARGVSSEESAGIGGMAHLVNFLGTDTMIALQYAHDTYNAPFEGLGYSVFATEHSVMTADGPAGEMEIVQDCLDMNPIGIVSVVADSYDYYNFVKTVGTKFKNQIVERNIKGGNIPTKFVIRPDSITPDHKTPEELVVWTYQQLEKDFGVTVNNKGYKELHPAISCLWGDGIDFNGIRKIFQALKDAGYSCGTQIVGQGGGLLQKLNRDTLRHAFKVSANYRNGKWVDIQKNPLDTSKKSKAGRLALTKDDNGKFITVKLEDLNGRKDYLETVFENGVITKQFTFNEVRKNANF